MKFKFKQAELGIFNSESADPALVGFKKNCRLMGLTRGLFSLIDLIHEILQKTGPADVICVTWSAGIKDAHQIEWMARSGLIKSFQIITDRSYVTRQEKYAVTLTELFGSENIRTTDIHAKFTLIKNDRFSVCIRTSMNLNANKTCENFEIDEDPKIFEFYYQFVAAIIQAMPEGWESRRAKIDGVLDRVFGIEKKKEKSTLAIGSMRRDALKRVMNEG